MDIDTRLPFSGDTYVRLFVPDSRLLTGEQLNRPWVLHMNLDPRSVLLSVVNVPTLLDVLGMGGSLGPPGFVVSAPAPYRADTTLRNRFVLNYLPGNKLYSSEDCRPGKFIGTCSVSGLILSFFEVSVPLDIQETTDDLELSAFWQGHAILRATEYTTPTTLLNRYAARPESTG
jgi:hypothetical protein